MKKFNVLDSNKTKRTGVSRSFWCNTSLTYAQNMLAEIKEFKKRFSWNVWRMTSFIDRLEECDLFEDLSYDSKSLNIWFSKYFKKKEIRRNPDFCPKLIIVYIWNSRLQNLFEKGVYYSYLIFATNYITKKNNLL